MKKVTILGAAVLCISILSATSAHAGGVLKLGFDSASQIEITGTGTTSRGTFDVDSGLSMAFELHGTFGDNVDIGVGIELQSYRNLTNYPLGDAYIRFIPIYLSMRVHPKVNGFTPYLSFQVGMAIFNADENITGNGFFTTTNGSHLAIGGGFIMGKNFFIELMASTDTGGLERNGTQVIDVSYSKVTLGFGLYF